MRIKEQLYDQYKKELQTRDFGFGLDYKFLTRREEKRKDEFTKLKRKVWSDGKKFMNPTRICTLKFQTATD